MTEPDRISAVESAAISVQRRRRNWAIFAALIVLMLLFYAITIVKLSKA